MLLHNLTIAGILLLLRYFKSGKWGTIRFGKTHRITEGLMPGNMCLVQYYPLKHCIRYEATWHWQLRITIHIDLCIEAIGNC